MLLHFKATNNKGGTGDGTYPGSGPHHPILPLCDPERHPFGLFVLSPGRPMAAPLKHAFKAGGFCTTEPAGVFHFDQ